MSSLREFVAAPIGRWVHVPPLLIWAASPRLCGIIYHGLVTSSDVPQLRALADLPTHPALARPYRAILDCSGLSGLDAVAFSVLVDHLRDLAERAAMIERVAVVRPSGITGAAALGLFHEHFAHRIDLRFVDDLDAAIRVVEAQSYADELVSLREVARGFGLIASLRRLLREQPQRSLAAAALQLGVSTRTLQRACSNAGSSFRNEVAAARLAFATSLLVSTSEKIETIARRAGYASAVSFTRRFQREHGVTPSEYRRRRVHGA